MPCQTAYSRHVLQRVSDRKKRKLAVDDSDKSSSSGRDADSRLPVDPLIDVIDDSQSSLKGHRDLFGQLASAGPCCSEDLPGRRASAEKTRPSKENVPPSAERIIESNGSSQRPPRVFIPTPQIIKLMKDAHSELYSLMGLNTSSSDLTVGSNDSLNISGVQDLQDSPVQSSKNRSKTTLLINENYKGSPPIFDGVVAFVDYKIDIDRSGRSIVQRLIELGAKVEKSFNLKVTHIVFRDGYRKTYDKAIERNIPLVSARWVEYSRMAGKMLNPADYPPVDIEKYKVKYTKTRIINSELPKYNSFKKFLRPSDFERDQLLRTKCNNLIERINKFTMEDPDESEENNMISETPQKHKNTLKQSNNPYRPNDIISMLSNQLSKVLTTYDSPIIEEEIDELYLPMSIKILRKFLTPNGQESITPELNSDLIQIEDRLNLNPLARKRLRKLLFTSDKEVINMSIESDFPSPSPEKLRISAPARLTSSKKHKIVFDKKEVLSHKNNLIDNEKTPLKKIVKDNIIHWQIPSDLRPDKIKKNIIHKKKNVNTTQSQGTLPNLLSRNSSVVFQTPKDSIASPQTLPTIACTGMKKCEVDIIQLCILNLGTYSFCTQVKTSTMFLVTKPQPNRTLNLLSAMAFGCYIVSEDWVHESHKVGRWISYQEYLISNLAKPVKEFQTRRNTFGSMLTFHIFDDVGVIYISNTCKPSARNLKRLVRACGGQCTNDETLANVVVGYTNRLDNNIHEKWILDCITQGTLLNKYQYKIVNNKN